ncbi:MAG TPA: hypothetical protein VGO11_19620 [Chthoniobacteraceae bacterium]|jgi:hypothetical protein|nr:hypothetical protein [Chthoniobacteraceae bacterium]
MRDYDVSIAVGQAIAARLAAAYATDPDQVGLVHTYAHGAETLADGTILERPADLLLPAVLIESKSSPLASSFSFMRMDLQISVESQVDDDTAAQHDARIRVVNAALSDLTALGIKFTGRGLELIGRPSPQMTEPGVEQRADRTVLAFRGGYRSDA